MASESPHFSLPHIVRLSRVVPLVQLTAPTFSCRDVLHFGLAGRGGPALVDSVDNLGRDAWLNRICAEAALPGAYIGSF